MLWGIAGILMLVIMWMVWGTSNHEGVRLVFSGVQKNTEGKPVMLNPRYQGVDVHNRPFTVTAHTATQLDNATVELNTITADTTTEHGKWAALQADTGQLNTATKQLYLTKNADLFYEGGFEIRSQYAHIDIPRGTVTGNQPVEGQGPPGTITANAFEVQDRGNRIIFTGNVRVVLYPTPKPNKKSGTGTRRTLSSTQNAKGKK